MDQDKQPICVRGMPFSALRRGNYYGVTSLRVENHAGGCNDRHLR